HGSDPLSGSGEVMAPAPVPAVPDWAIALLVLVCILLLLSILTCLLMVSTSCTCRRKSHGKLDLFSAKDSYHPMAEYPPYQSHGRYVSPNSKPNPYSQVRAKCHRPWGCLRLASWGRDGAGEGAFRCSWAGPLTAGLMANGAGEAEDGDPGSPPHAGPLPLGR
uniref:Mucin 1, cell surface associated n=1 Tax=Athene cunicularia TaxID=194338 RepID=A0A663N5E7_ATHCN